MKSQRDLSVIKPFILSQKRSLFAVERKYLVCKSDTERDLIFRRKDVRKQ